MLNFATEVFFGPGSRAGAARLALAAVLAAAAPASLAAIVFEDVTSGSGVEYTGESYASSWGDYNSDGLPDLFVSHHREAPGLYVNLGNGSFEDRSFAIDVWQSLPHSDQHGAAWSDFDKDGDNDLFVSTGAKNNSQFLVHNGTFLTDRTSDYTFDVKAWGGRLPIWFDFSRDGKMDFAMALQGQKPHIHERIGSDFIRVNNSYGMNCLDNDYGQFADLTGDGFLEWICIRQAAFPDKIYDFSVKPFVDRTSLIPQIPNAIDSAFADFDGDGVSDAIVQRGKERISGAAIVMPTKIEAHLINTDMTESGMSFRTTGDVTFDLHWNARNVANIFIGATGKHPPFVGPTAPLTFTLSPSDPEVVGLMPRNSNPDKESIYIGYDPATQTWQFWNVSVSWSYVYAFVDSTQPVSDLMELSLTALDSLGGRPPAMFMHQAGAWVDRTNQAGFQNFNMPCISLVAADFDNDMDVDLYLVCRGAVTNERNRLFENNGNGVFTEVTANFGARGPVGPFMGLGESVTFADYDVDGFIDLFVTNGLALFPEIPNSNGGPDKLYKNAGNNNHWIQLDLVGTTSNRDGMGARVIATAGGKSQLREQNGGYHRWAQNQQRLHFGLAGNTVVNTLAVRWPSGMMQTFNNVAADKVYRITEGGTIEEVVLPDEVEPSPCGPAGGMPLFNAGTDQGVFMGKDCVTGEWQVRVAGGGGSASFRGDVTADQAFSQVTGFSLEPNDTLDFTTNPKNIFFVLGVGGSGVDGFDFSFPAGSNVCFSLNRPPGAVVRVGGAGTQVSQPFDLETLGPCQSTQPPECGLPAYNAGAEQAFFIGKDCNAGVWQVRVTAGGSNTSFRGNVSATQPFASVTGFSQEASDTLDASTNPSVITYIQNVGGSGQDGFNFVPAAGAQVCVGLDAPAGVPVLLGADRQALSVPFDLATFGPCSNEPPPSSCGGLPTYDKATEQGVFIGQDCATEVWRARMTAGGGSVTYTGSVNATEAFTTVNGFSLENNDTLDATTDPAEIAYSLKMGGSGQDGFDFTFPAAADACFGLDAPSGAPVFFGSDRTPVSVPFDLRTLGSCQ